MPVTFAIAKTVSVTDADLRMGVRCHAELCPLALALRRVVAPTYDPIVGLFSVGFQWSASVDFDKYASVELPKHVIAWQYQYDCDNNAQPFTFVLEIPTFVLNSDAPTMKESK